VSMDKGQEKHLEERMCRQGSILRWHWILDLHLYPVNQPFPGMS
jgi:hypothetical protein